VVDESVMVRNQMRERNRSEMRCKGCFVHQPKKDKGQRIMKH
jgi:hypothetical protein